MTIDGLEVKRAVVCGAGYSGQALTRTLRRLGAEVDVTDSRPAGNEVLDAAQRVLADLGATLSPGGHAPAVVGAADLVVVSPGVAWGEPALVAARAQGTPVWGEIEFASRLTPARLVGITGTKGKSTTAAVTALMLDAPLTNSEAYSARGIPLIDFVVEDPQADPIVVEVTSYQLEGIVDFRPWVGTLLNIAEDHTDRHPTRADYVAAKRRIFENQRDGDRSVVNLDDEAVAAIGAELSTLVLHTSERVEPAFGVWSTAEGVRVRVQPELGGHDELLARWPEVSHGLTVQKPSLLAAVATALAAEAPLAAIARQVREFPGLPHRMELVRTWRGLTFVNDSKATNPLAVGNAIAQSPAPVVLLAGGQTKGIDLAPLAEPFGRLRGLVVYGQDAQLLAEVASRGGQQKIMFAKSLEEALEQGVNLACDGDWVVLSPCGASFDMFRNFAHRGEVFRELVRSLGE